jgi:hypothetical protein
VAGTGRVLTAAAVRSVTRELHDCGTARSKIRAQKSDQFPMIGRWKYLIKKNPAGGGSPPGEVLLCAWPIPRRILVQAIRKRKANARDQLSTRQPTISLNLSV